MPPVPDAFIIRTMAVQLELSYLDILAEGDTDFKKEYLDTFESTYTTLIKKMRDEYVKEDFTNLGKSAHQLKPSAKMIHLPSGTELEDLQHNPDTATVARIDAIEQEFKEAHDQLLVWAQS